MALPTKMGDTRTGRFSQDGPSIALDNGAAVYRGIDRNKREHVIYQNGDAQNGIPTAAVASAVLSGTVITLTELVESFHDAHKLDALVKAVEKLTGGKFTPKQ